MSQERDAKAGIERRRFLQGAGLAVGGVAAVAAAAAAQDGGKREAPQEQVKARYRETPEVKRYYALNRL